MSASQYLVGIDLGTTNTVVAYATRGSDDIRLFEIEQLVAPGEVAARALLPSLRYHAATGELPAEALALPWARADAAAPVVVGQLARQLGAQVPGRLVASAKSWLSHAAVDRTAAILPWGAADDVAKVSPVAASASYLAHVRAAWNARFPEAPLERQDIVLTVPASFDDGARALTLAAARDAGLPELRLLEEPQAACYDWLFRHRATLGGDLAATRLALVCDVGGGTTDLSLIRVELQDGKPVLSRIGVGNHLMLGGDNMDLALAHLAESRLATEPGARLSAGRLSQLIERCRAAKEQLLAADAPERAPVTLLGAGSKLIGASRSADLLRDEVEQLIVDGFFPRVGLDELARQTRAGLVEFGLPYAADAAITRHVASFLRHHATAAREALGSGDGAAVPDTLLLNGGVFRADALARRLADTLGDWRGQPLTLLDNPQPDVAVARGAVAYALARHGRAPRIGGGSPRSYFLLLDDAPAAQDAAPQRAVCLLPRGSEAGREIALAERSFALRLGQPVRFHLVSATAEAQGQAVPAPGELIDLADGEFTRLPPIATVLPAARAGAQQDIPVQLATTLTEVGTLAMHCVDAADSNRRWQLEFQLRGDTPPSAASEALPPRFGEAVDRIDRIFGTRAKGVAPDEVKQLRHQLERLLGERDNWPTAWLRPLFDALWQRAKGRRRSAEHERLWLNLAGFCLRPGYGHALDDWRVSELWSLFDSGVQHGGDKRVCSEWWTLWRRIAGGLEQPQQLRLLQDFELIMNKDKAAIRARAVPPVKGSEDDMVRLAASLERIPADFKRQIGAWLVSTLPKPGGDTSSGELPRTLWVIGRLGARQPFYGSAHEVIAPDAVAPWLDALLALDWKRIEPAAFAAAHLARLTGDRPRDLPEPLREQVAKRLEALRAAPIWIAMPREVVELDSASQQRVLGETLPPGLMLIG
ncbi:Hsp70 family protein [Chitinivorax sp. PXF-14]|uniref:Hsp70 family protein n=1 Tax=Chitinivorax sp. PXF-14 TaxID=3230488 RepID=UPI00346794E1